MNTPLRISIDADRVREFCRKWRITELALFGSSLRDDFRADSDIDLVVSFEPAATWTLWDYVEMRDELAHLFGRPVDLVSKRGLKNPFRRHEILTTRQVIYAA